MEAIKLYKKPKLKAPQMFAVWPGMGNVGPIAADYLCRKLGAKELGEIDPSGFFYHTGISVRHGLLELPRLPENRFYYWQGKGSLSDLLIFIAEVQPQARGFQLANLVIDVAKQFGVERIYTSGASAVIPHPARPRVLTVPNNSKLLEYLKKYDVVLLGEGAITGLNGLLLGVAREGGIDGICLMGELSYYATRVENPKSSKAVLEVLSKMLGIEVDFQELEEFAQRMEPKIQNLVKRKMLAFGGVIKLVRPEEEPISDVSTGVPESAKIRIEELFEEARHDRSKVFELKAELDKWGLFERYQDRFLDLFEEEDR